MFISPDNPSAVFSKLKEKIHQNHSLFWSTSCVGYSNVGLVWYGLYVLVGVGCNGCVGCSDVGLSDGNELYGLSPRAAALPRDETLRNWLRLPRLDKPPTTG